MQIKQVLIDQSIDFFNNYLTISKYAEDNGMSIQQAQTVISLGKQLHGMQFVEDHFQFIKVG
jgi:hypothetical protein